MIRRLLLYCDKFAHIAMLAMTRSGTFLHLFVLFFFYSICNKLFFFIAIVFMVHTANIYWACLQGQNSYLKQTHPKMRQNVENIWVGKLTQLSDGQASKVMEF